MGDVRLTYDLLPHYGEPEPGDVIQFTRRTTGEPTGRYSVILAVREVKMREPRYVAGVPTPIRRWALTVERLAERPSGPRLWPFRHYARGETPLDSPGHVPDSVLGTGLSPSDAGLTPDLYTVRVYEVDPRIPTVQRLDGSLWREPTEREMAEAAQHLTDTRQAPGMPGGSRTKSVQEPEEE